MSDALTPVQYIENAKNSLQAAMTRDEEGQKPDQDTTNLYLGNAVYSLALALEGLGAPQHQPPAKTKKKVRKPKQSAPTGNLWQRLPLPAYIFTKAAVLSMLQELSNFVRRS